MNNDQQKTLEDLYEGSDEKHIDKPVVKKKPPVAAKHLPKSPQQFGNLRHMIGFVVFVLVLIIITIFAGFRVFL